MPDARKVEALSASEAAAELRRLAETLNRANLAYHRDDAPEISDAEYDTLKQRNLAQKTKKAI